MLLLVSLIILFPFLGFLLNITLGRTSYYSRQIVSIVGVSTVILAFSLSLTILLSFSYEVLQNGTVYQLYPFISTEYFSIDIGFLIDSLSLLFMLIITGIGALIHIFSMVYMEEENNANYARYFAYLNLFIFFMLVLVMGSNLLVTFIGWEGVGLCSYLLIGFWFEKPSNIVAANKAFIMNRIGDLAFLLATFLLAYNCRTLDYNELQFYFESNFVIGTSVITLIGILLFFAATGKSAQLPLFTWLPDAMAGPTPVSALIHAATMVTAGIFLMTRFFYLVDMSALLGDIMLVIGCLTAFITATAATVQKDIKKVLAYSTVSQLGFMVVALAVGAYVSSVFHVLTHAFFKALLFLGSGSIIYVLHHEQLLSKMGGLKRYLPITHITFLIASLSIAGIPPFAGFFSKDEILAALFVHSPVFYVIMQLTAWMTTFYIFRLYALVFLGKYRGKMDTSSIKEGNKWMTLPLLILAVSLFVVGLLGIPPMIADLFGGQHILVQYLYAWKGGSSHGLSHKVEWILSSFATLSSLIVIIVTLRYYKSSSQASETQLQSDWKNFLLEYWYIDKFYNRVIVNPIVQLGNFLYKKLDVDVIRNVPMRLEMLVMHLGGRVQLLQGGVLSRYFLWMITFLFLIIVCIAVIF